MTGPSLGLRLRRLQVAASAGAATVAADAALAIEEVTT